MASPSQTDEREQPERDEPRAARDQPGDREVARHAAALTSTRVRASGSGPSTIGSPSCGDVEGRELRPVPRSGRWPWPGRDRERGREGLGLGGVGCDHGDGERPRLGGRAGGGVDQVVERSGPGRSGGGRGPRWRRRPRASASTPSVAPGRRGICDARSATGRVRAPRRGAARSPPRSTSAPGRPGHVSAIASSARVAA